MGLQTEPVVPDEVIPYREQSWVTAPGHNAHLYADLPDDLPDLCRAIQGLLVHYMGEMPIAPERLCEIDTRRVEAMLDRIMEMDGRSLTDSRPLEKRLVGCCRDYAVLLCSVLRHRGIPARARFGFSTYFRPDFLPDHVVTEYWNETEGRWVLVDAELSEETISHNGITFDPLDLPRDRYLVAGEAWQRCRDGSLDPDRCGVDEEICGLGFVAGYVALDLAALARLEALPWDSWGVTDLPPGESLNDDVLLLVDEVARSTAMGRTGGLGDDPRLKPAGEIRSYSAAGFYTLTLPEP